MHGHYETRAAVAVGVAIGLIVGIVLFIIFAIALIIAGFFWYQEMEHDSKVRPPGVHLNKPPNQVVNHGVVAVYPQPPVTAVQMVQPQRAQQPQFVRPITVSSIA